MDSDVVMRRDPDEPEPVELIAQSIISIAQAFERAMKAGLRQHTIVLLLHEYTRVPKGHIAKILEAAPRLALTYVSAEKLRQLEEGQ